MKRLLAAAVVVAASVHCFAGKDDAAEPKLRSAAAAEIVKYAQWCADNGAKSEALRVVAEAEALDAEAPGLADVKGKLESEEGDADGAAAAVAKKRSSAAAPIAKAYDRLAALDLGGPGDPRATDYLMRAVA